MSGDHDMRIFRKERTSYFKVWEEIGESIKKDRIGIARGDLTWHDHNDSKRHLEMGVTNDGIIVAEFCPSDVNVLKGGLPVLYKCVEKIMIERAGQSYPPKEDFSEYVGF